MREFTFLPFPGFSYSGLDYKIDLGDEVHEEQVAGLQEEVDAACDAEGVERIKVDLYQNVRLNSDIYLVVAEKYFNFVEEKLPAGLLDGVDFKVVRVERANGKFGSSEKLIFTLNLTEEFHEKLRAASKLPEFAEIIQSHHMSRPDFMSLYTDNVDEWRQFIDRGIELPDKEFRDGCKPHAFFAISHCFETLLLNEYGSDWDDGYYYDIEVDPFEFIKFSGELAFMNKNTES